MEYLSLKVCFFYCADFYESHIAYRCYLKMWGSEFRSDRLLNYERADINPFTPSSKFLQAHSEVVRFLLVISDLLFLQPREIKKKNKKLDIRSEKNCLSQDSSQCNAVRRNGLIIFRDLYY
jgi:hypothetical protein